MFGGKGRQGIGRWKRMSIPTQDTRHWARHCTQITQLCPETFYFMRFNGLVRLTTNKMEGSEEILRACYFCFIPHCLKRENQNQKANPGKLIFQFCFKSP